jgi:hypothetical protein
MNVKEILRSGTPQEQRALFTFDQLTSDDRVRLKCNLWSRWFFPQFFPSRDAPFHERIDKGNLGAYRRGGSFLDIAFRGSAKTTRTKLFIAFCIANDLDHLRKYIKVLSRDSGQSKQTSTDIYNLLISRRVKALYPEIFERTDTKREETMASFTTATGIKVTSDSIGTDQRGDIQDESRPDLIWYDDFETVLSLSSAVVTHKIWENMEEAKNGLAKGGGSIYTGNYISERGNVHRLVEKVENQINIPIEENGKPTWERYTADDVAKLKRETDNYAGEYLGKPSASRDVYFDRLSVEKQEAIEPLEEIAGLKIYRKYDPSHRIGSGHDVSGGVGLDSSTSVFWDFDCYPAQVIATYRSNEIKPDAFAHEIARQGKRFGENYVAVEKNYGSTIDILKSIYPTDKLHRTERSGKRVFFQAPTEYGWDTNGVTKPTMLVALAQALESGMVSLNDRDLIAEVRGYTTGDLMDGEVDPRLTTRHFDLLMAAAIGWQTNRFILRPAKPRVEDFWQERKDRIEYNRKEQAKNPAK